MVITAATVVAGAVPPPSPPPKTKAGTLATTPPLAATRRHLILASAASALPATVASAAAPPFAEIPSSGGVKALDLREGSGELPADGDQVAIHYYGRLAAKQGWRFDSTYDHKDETGDPMPFVFTIGSGKGDKSCHDLIHEPCRLYLVLKQQCSPFLEQFQSHRYRLRGTERKNSDEGKSSEYTSILKITFHYFASGSS